MRVASSFPLARCVGCGRHDACEARGWPEPSYPACHRPLPGIDLGRARALFAWLSKEAGVDDARLGAVEDAVLGAVARDHERRWNALEPSFSIEDGIAHLYRFSYALPDLRLDARGTAATLRSFAAPLGDVAVDACERALRAARSPVVRELLFGLAHDGAAGLRPKVYVQMRPGARSEALALAGAMLGAKVDALEDAGELHLVGLDLGARGLAAAKLYFSHPRVALGEAIARLGRAPLLDALRDAGATELVDALTIHRLAGPDDVDVARPVELDLGLAECELRWPDVRRLPPMAAVLARHPVVAQLEASFRLDVRRVSVGLDGRDKLNVYYALAEPAGPAHGGHR
jgi:hypothetical protein